MDYLRIDLSRLSRWVIIISFCIALMYLASSILIPLTFALFFSLLLYPPSAFLERKLPRIISILIVFLGVLIIISGVLFFFGSFFYSLFENIKSFSENIQSLIARVVSSTEKNILQNDIDLSKIVKNESAGLMGSGEVIEKTLSISSDLLISLVLVTVFTFLFLLYRSSFKKFILFHFPNDKQEKGSLIIKTIQKVIQRYFLGLFIIILILGTLNGIGLSIIGIDHPFLFGFFGAILAVIPYIGTFIGGLLPFLYALIYHDSIWAAIFVVLWYTVVQTLEGNVLTPKIVGSKVSLNPLIALLALLVGGLIWGLAGIIIFIPLMAIIKVIFDNIDALKPYGLLLGSNFGNEKSRSFKDLGKKIRKTSN